MDLPTIIRDRPPTPGHSESPRASIGQWLVRFALPFALVLYLGLRGGGYDLVVRDQIGVLIWWSVLVIAVFGLAPQARFGTAGKAAVILLAGLAIWTGSSSLWSESAERSISELSRVLSYMGVFVLFSLLHGKGSSRMMVAAIGTAIVVIAAFALASRLHPSLQWGADTAVAIPGVRSRLSFPLGYWNGLAALVALGIPLMIWAACCSRNILLRSLAGAAIPLLSLTLFLTLSRGGAFAAIAGILVLFGLSPNRCRLLLTTLIVAFGSAVCIFAATGREDLMDGRAGSLATTQGWEMLAVLLVACAVTALLLGLLSSAGRRIRPAKFAITDRGRRLLLAALALSVVVSAIVFIASGRPADLWQEFKQPDTTSSSSSRFEVTSGNGRYQYWSAAVEAAQAKPLLGIGPGSFEFWWDREGTLAGSVGDAHSLYLETFAELGLPGLLIVVGLILTPIAVAARLAIADRSSERVGIYAAASAAMAVFAVSAAIDWVWELAVLPVCFILLAASATGDAGGSARPQMTRTGIRFGAAAAALLCAIAISIPLAATSLLAKSQDQVAAGDLPAAFESADQARLLEPYAATPYLQKALVQERIGDLDGAVANAYSATRREATNWRTWLVLGRLDAFTGDARGSIAAFGKVHMLNPHSYPAP